MSPSLDDLLALLPDNGEGAITAAVMREVVAGLYGQQLAAVSGVWHCLADDAGAVAGSVRIGGDNPMTTNSIVPRVTDAQGIDHSALFDQTSIGSMLTIRAVDDPDGLWVSYGITSARTPLEDPWYIGVYVIDGAPGMSGADFVGADVQLIFDPRLP